VIRPKLEHAVKRGSTRGRIAARWSDAALWMARGSRSGLITEADFAAQAAGAGIGRFVGARIGMSVAEIGEKHLPGDVEVSREAIQDGAG
jgi:hypothetical protein